MMKHVSLLRLDPAAILELRSSGRCTLLLPEEIFDLDLPGHYFRRLKSVAVTSPASAGRTRASTARLRRQRARSAGARSCGTAAMRAKAPRTIASMITSAGRSPSSPALGSMTPASATQTQATSATYRSRERAQSATGSWSCPRLAGPIGSNSTTPRSPTSSCTSATQRGKAARCFGTQRWPTSGRVSTKPERPRLSRGTIGDPQRRNGAHRQIGHSCNSLFGRGSRVNADDLELQRLARCQRRNVGAYEPLGSPHGRWPTRSAAARATARTESGLANASIS